VNCKLCGRVRTDYTVLTQRYRLTRYCSVYVVCRQYGAEYCVSPERFTAQFKFRYARDTQSGARGSQWEQNATGCQILIGTSRVDLPCLTKSLTRFARSSTVSFITVRPVNLTRRPNLRREEPHPWAREHS